MLAERIRRALVRRKGIGEKNAGNLLIGVREDSLLVRLGPGQGDETLQEAHVSEFKIGGRAR